MLCRERSFVQGCAMHMTVIHWVAIATLAIPPVAYGPDAPNPPAAAQLVQAVRQCEQWVRRVDSLWLKVDVTWTKTEPGLAHRRDLLARQVPGQVLDPNRYVDLQPVSHGRIEVAFDRQRVRFLHELDGYWAYLTVWDGQQLVRYERQSCPDREWTILEDRRGDAFDNCLAPMSCLRSAPPGLWWCTEDANEALPTYGRSEEFVHTGRCTYRGTDCHVLEVSPREVRGLMIGHGPGQMVGAQREYGFIGEVKGIIDQSFRWYVGVEDHRLRGLVCLSEGRPFVEYWLSQYEQVRSGFWFPMVQGSEVYEKQDFGQPYVDCRCDLKVTDLRIDASLPDSLFHVDLPADARVYDRRAGQFTAKATQGLVGKTLPLSGESGIPVDPNGIAARSVLVCFFDMQQRPSRNCLLQLAKQAEALREKGVGVVAVQASKMGVDALKDWVSQNAISFPVGTIGGDEEKTRLAWGVKALPWLILTNRQHVVKAEGFGLQELNEKIE
jgi:hypothetical protein